VVSISFSPYAEETVMVSETAASVGARQIVITDSQISPWRRSAISALW
jgi:DNA-binding MurR/RpiR family transcriptional regulator